MSGVSCETHKSYTVYGYRTERDNGNRTFLDLNRATKAFYCEIMKSIGNRGVVANLGRKLYDRWKGLEINFNLGHRRIFLLHSFRS